LDAVTDVEYAIDLEPRAAILGEPIVALLSCRARSAAPQVLTFGHRSLVIELDRPALPEPGLAFPNRHAVEDRGRLIRMSAPGGVEALAAGDERTRRFDLVALFPHLVLAPGPFTATYRLEEADPLVRPQPVKADVRSGPEAVPRLIGLLSAESSGARFRAAELLTAMTANDFDYRAGGDVAARGEAIQRWWAWWHEAGSRLPWTFDTEGATFGRPAVAAESAKPGEHLGGIAYPERPARPA
jgi:hypothetical protein